MSSMLPIEEGRVGSCRAMQNLSIFSPYSRFRTKLQHPSFWPTFKHNEGDYGFYFNTEARTGKSAPWETHQLNVTDEHYFDYTYLHPEDPPEFIPFSWEVFEWRWWGQFGSSYWGVAPVVGLLYVALIFALERYMSDKPAYNLKWPLFFWNAGLSIFSVFGFVRTFPEFLSVLLDDDGFYKSICYRNGGNWPMGFWSLAWVLSKYLELGDTVFIVLRKRPLMFIQWYHHLITLVVSWLAAPYVEPISRWYVVMNYAVHSMMYPYFAVAVLGVKIPRKIQITITTCQLAQMIMGLFVNFSSAFLIRIGVPCYRHPFSIKMCFIVYGSFTILFGKLYRDIVYTRAQSKKSKSE